MSMSQEEIEALMNGLDIEETEEETSVENEQSPNDSVSEDDINKLINETQAVEDSSLAEVSDDDIDKLVNSFEEDREEIHEASEEDLTVSIEDTAASFDNEIEQNTDLDDILSGLDGDVGSDEDADNTLELASMDEISSEYLLSSPKEVEEEIKETLIENTEEIIPTEEITKEVNEAIIESSNIEETDSIGKNWADDKIEQGVFPPPVESNHKVVNQLSEVANDSEEKATMVFDIFSEILDNNLKQQEQLNQLNTFVNKQHELLEKLSNKFPNIEEFKDSLISASEIKDLPTVMLDDISNEDQEIFKAMELMQFHDIHRQKIERVMSVIRKLSRYLSNLFDDDGSQDNTPIASHISGDNNSSLVENDDLDALIKEFGK